MRLAADIFTARKSFDDAVIEYKRAVAIDRYDAVSRQSAGHRLPPPAASIATPNSNTGKSSGFARTIWMR